MKKDRILEQLESIKGTSQSHLTHYGFNDIMANDIIALDYAIKKVKKDKSYTESYWQGAWHMFLLILLVKITDTLFNMFWGY